MELDKYFQKSELIPAIVQEASQSWPIPRSPSA